MNKKAYTGILTYSTTLTYEKDEDGEKILYENKKQDSWFHQCVWKNKHNLK